jgi:uncharacterized protein YkwD
VALGALALAAGCAPVPPSVTPSPPLALRATPTGAPGATRVPTATPAELEAGVIAALNREREKAGLTPLARDTAVSAFAQFRVDDLVTRGYFGHTTPEGTSVFELMAARGLVYQFAGENLALTTTATPAAAENAVGGFMVSPSHRDNVLKPEYRLVGVGVRIVEGGTTYFAVMFFTRP